LLKLLSHRGFDSKWISWIVALLGSITTKIIDNGEPTENIRHMRGLRQGDPISHLLFVLVMDCLGRLLDKEQNDPLLPQIGNQVLRFGISLYVDDVVIFLRLGMNDMKETMVILQILQCHRSVY
jgi:hypothetical protein